jgi:hypothetical protein
VSQDDELAACGALSAERESLAEKREPTGGGRHLADRLLSVATMEIQDPITEVTWLRGTRGEVRSQRRAASVESCPPPGE